MFKFDGKIKDLHKFTKKINDLHTFTTKIKDLHTFAIKCLDAIIIKKLNINEKAKADVYIGNQKIKLSSLPEKLRDLPVTLRQFTGSYVYLKVKARFSNIVWNTASAIGKLKAKARISNIVTVVNTISAKLTIKGVFQSNITESNIAMKFIRRIKGGFSDITSYVINDSPSILKAKAKFSEQCGAIQNLKSRLLAKAKIATSANTSISLSYYQGKSKKLVGYTDTTLNELPATLKDFCFEYVNRMYLITKGDMNESYFTTINVGTDQPTDSTYFSFQEDTNNYGYVTMSVLVYSSSTPYRYTIYNPLTTKANTLKKIVMIVKFEGGGAYTNCSALVRYNSTNYPSPNVCSTKITTTPVTENGCTAFKRSDNYVECTWDVTTFSNTDIDSSLEFGIFVSGLTGDFKIQDLYIEW